VPHTKRAPTLGRPYPAPIGFRQEIDDEQALYDEAKKDGWTVISMKNDWKRIFAFE
jgi:hypothetical protein